MDGIYEVVIGGVDQKGEYAENVCHFDVQGSLTSSNAHTTAHALCLAISTTLVPLLVNTMGTDVHLNILNARLVTGSMGPTAHFLINQGGVSGNPSFSMALAASAAMFPGGARLRAGRWFFWGLDTAAFLAGFLSPAALGAIQGFLNTLITPLALTVGSAVYGTFTKRSVSFTPTTDFEIAEKGTGMTKRTRPIT